MIMQRTGSRTSLPLPNESTSYRGYQLLQEYRRTSQEFEKNSSEVPKKPPEVSEEEKSFSLNSSLLLSPEKDVSIREDEPMESSQSNNDQCVAEAEDSAPIISTATTESLKKCYISAMKDLKKGFHAVVELVSRTLTAVSENKQDKNLLDLTRKALRRQRYWVDCSSMQTKFHPAPTVEEAVTQEQTQSEEKVKREGSRFRAKRHRRFHFQILLRIALLKVICDKKFIKADAKNETFLSLCKDAADLVRAFAVGEKYDFVWQFMESEIQYKCGKSPIVYQIINEICDELLIPLPMYLKEPKQKTPLKSAPISRESSDCILSSSQCNQPMVGSRRFSSQTSAPLDTRKSFSTLSSSFNHRFIPQRSVIGFGSCSQPASKLLPTSSQSVVKAPQILDHVKRTLSFPTATSTPIKASPKRIADVSSRSIVSQHEHDPMMTPQRIPLAQKTTVPKGTPYRHRQDAISQGKSPAGTGVSRMLAEFSPFQTARTASVLRDNHGLRSSASESVRRRLF